MILSLVLAAAGAFAAGGAPDSPDAKTPNAASRYNEGLALKAKKDWTHAEAAFGAAVKLEPDLVDAWNELGHALKMQLRYDDAIRAYQEALRQRPDFARAIEYLGEVYAAQGRKAEADAQLAKLQTLDPALAKDLEAAIARGGKGDWE